MARSLIDSGSTSLTLATDTALKTWDAPSGGANYVLVVYATPLQNGESLFAYFEREVRANTDTRTEEWRISMAAHSGSCVVSTPFFGAAENCEMRVGIRQEGGTGRTIPWVIERVDG